MGRGQGRVPLVTLGSGVEPARLLLLGTCVRCSAAPLLPRVLRAQPASLVLPPLVPGAAVPRGCPSLVPSVSSGCFEAAPPTPCAARGVSSDAAPHQPAEPTLNQLGVCRAMGSLAGGCHPRPHLGFLRGSQPAWAVLWERGPEVRACLLGPGKCGPVAGECGALCGAARSLSLALSCNPDVVLGYTGLV